MMRQYHNDTDYEPYETPSIYNKSHKKLDKAVKGFYSECAKRENVPFPQWWEEVKNGKF